MAAIHLLFDVYALGKNMIKVEIMIKDVNYGNIAEKVIPMVLKKLAEKNDRSSKLAKVLGSLKGMPNKLVKAALDVMPQQAKDELTVHFLTEYKEEIVKYINRIAKEKQIAVEVDEVAIKKVD